MGPDSPLFVGFDLGTSNSAAAVFDGATVQVVHNSAGGALTPSVVRIDARGRVTVGHRAARSLERDPTNTRREFKRLMGSTKRLHFADSNEERLPEELSAEILSAMRKDVEDVTGTSVTRAVISVPALFELPQAKATSQAAHLAGFEQVELLQEPVASALAAGWHESESGVWMVYDLGGGTFDVSLLETRDGLLRIIGHDGDNFLGGRDMDRAIADWVAKQLRQDTQASLERNNPAHAEAWQALHRAAEMAKIELTRSMEAELYLDEPLRVDGRDVEVSMSLDRATLEGLCEPLLRRSLDVCHRLLQSNGLTASQLAKVVLVGGPSIMPSVRQRVEASLAAPVATGHDPMTLVAQGAALFAATANLDTRQGTKEPEGTSEARNCRVWCQYPPVSADLEPYVIGRCEATHDKMPTHIQLVRVRPGPRWESETTALDEEMAFCMRTSLVPRAPNQFRLVATRSGVLVPVLPEEITIIQGLTIGAPPLSRSIGVALADDSVHTYFERGTPLPSRRTFTHKTVETIAAGAEGSALAIPIVQGEFEQAHLCWLVGALRIHGEDVTQTIPSGTPVEISLLVDRGGKLSATARVMTAQGRGESLATLSFDEVAQLVMPQPTYESIQENLRTIRRRLGDAQSAAFREGVSSVIGRLGALEQTLSDVETLSEAVSGGDVDAGQQAARQLLEVDAALYQMDSELRWPELEADAMETYSWALGWCGQLGKPAESRVLDRCGAALERAIERKNVPELLRQLRVIRRVGSTCYRRNPESWVGDFRYCASRLEETKNLAEAKALVDRGHAALDNGDMVALRTVVKEFWGLLPSDPEVRRLSYESGLQ